MFLNRTLGSVYLMEYTKFFSDFHQVYNTHGLLCGESFSCCPSLMTGKHTKKCYRKQSSKTNATVNPGEEKLGCVQKKEMDEGLAVFTVLTFQQCEQLFGDLSKITNKTNMPKGIMDIDYYSV